MVAWAVWEQGRVEQNKKPFSIRLSLSIAKI